MRWKKACYGAIAVLGLAVLACVLPLPSRVSVSYEAIVWSAEDPSLAEPCTVTAAGTYRRYLLRDNKFEGRLKASAVEQLAGNDAIQLTFLDYPQVYAGKSAELLIYDGDTNRYTRVGNMVIGGTFETIWICLDDGVTCLSAPAATRQEAEAIAAALTSAASVEP